jgi:phage-related protein
MELLYFISGILSVGVVYGIKLLRTVKSSHTELLDTFNKSQYISSTRRAEIGERLDDLEILIKDIQTNMEKDQYENLGNINKRMGELDKISKDNLDKIKFAGQSSDKNFSTVFSEIQQIKKNFKALSQDNFIR